MSRSNYDKPFYVDVGTSIVAIRCASNHDVVERYDFGSSKGSIKFANDICDRMNEEAAISRPSRPPRNCDVGSPQEQGERCLEQFDKWRRKFEGDKVVVAIMKWSQMSYKKEGEE